MSSPRKKLPLAETLPAIEEPIVEGVFETQRKRSYVGEVAGLKALKGLAEETGEGSYLLDIRPDSEKNPSTPAVRRSVGVLAGTLVTMKAEHPGMILDIEPFKQEDPYLVATEVTPIGLAHIIAAMEVELVQEAA